MSRDAELLRRYAAERSETAFSEYNKSLREVGLELGLTENAARMRVERALDKLRRCLARKGVTSTAAALALVLSGNAVNSAPAGFVSALAGASWAGAASQTGTAFGLSKFMAATKLKIGLSALALAGATVTLVLQHQAWLRAQEENDALRRQIAQLQADNDALSTRLARANRSRSPHLPAPALNASASGGALSGADSPASLYDRLMNNPPKVTTALHGRQRSLPCRRLFAGRVGGVVFPPINTAAASASERSGLGPD